MSADKNELLFSEFSINYNFLPEIFRKGTVLLWTNRQVSKELEPSVTGHQTAVNEGMDTSRKSNRVVIGLHEDIIREDFWVKHPDVLV